MWRHRTSAYGWPCYTGAGTQNNMISGCGPASNYRAPIWQSGNSTLATSGGAFVGGSQWADYTGEAGSQAPVATP